MDFRLLGPLEIGYGTRLLTLGAARQRAVLAVLLLSANRTVSVESLADRIWGHERPASARRTIRTYISRIRQILPEPVLQTNSTGYLLRIPPAALDLHRFEQGTAYARARLATDPAAAATALRAALALWRGPALADLGPAMIRDTEGPRLRELRLAAIEDRIDAELRLGHHARLIGELLSLAAHHPLRERLVGQLMVALDRSGQRADALAVYRRTRDRLVEELGVEPGPALRQVHRQVLTDQAHLRTVLRTRTSAPVVVRAG
ncbi:AfsR/SARP family transcriptional regulator [Micromonospora sp. FIMYZ51]|uniref:AfsR/SARP family transcriptional regulator n=1 Tax=Micromonospora sp. FIMYZ51 TaxID=3051832 RepID=UPI00311F410F